MNVPLLILASSVVALGWVWALRYWQLRTWRTVAVLATGTAVLYASAFLLPMPFGLLIGTPIAGQAFWLVASGSRLLCAMPDPDYAYSELLRVADHDASALLSRLNEQTLDEAEAGLALIIERLAAPAPDADWERVRKLKVQEFDLALALVRGRLAVAETALRKQQELRSQARDEFIAVRKAKSSFWR